MALEQAQFVRTETIWECPECHEEFNSNEIEKTTEMNSGKWVHTIAECPSCKKIISIGCK